MWIMTRDGWRKLQLTVTTSDDASYERIVNGYIARTKADQYRELAAMVVPEKYR